MRQIIKIIISVAAITLLISQHGCRDKGTEPVPPKNPREFTWTIDTLIAHPDAIQTNMLDIYATSPQNVFVVGVTDWSGVNGDGVLWRYDGTRWSIINQGFREVGLWSITGFGESNIYAAGGKEGTALILHFDGTRWIQELLPAQSFFAIAGSNSSNIWAGGWMGSAFHFDGTRWWKVPLDNKLSIRSLAILDGTTYATAYRPSETFPADSIWRFFLRWNNTRWDTLDTYLEAGNAYTQTFGMALSVIDGQLYSAGGGVFVFRSDKWKKIFDGPNVWKVVGTNHNNMFASGFQGAVYHFNGDNWFQFTQFSSSSFGYSGIWFDGREVFIVGNDGRKTIVLHGK